MPRDLPKKLALCTSLTAQSQLYQFAPLWQNPGSTPHEGSFSEPNDVIDLMKFQRNVVSRFPCDESQTSQNKI